MHSVAVRVPHTPTSMIIPISRLSIFDLLPYSLPPSFRLIFFIAATHHFEATFKILVFLRLHNDGDLNRLKSRVPVAPSFALTSQHRLPRLDLHHLKENRPPSIQSTPNSSHGERAPLRTYPNFGSSKALRS